DLGGPFLSRLLDALPVGIAALDAEGRMVGANAAFAELLDLDEYERRRALGEGTRWRVSDPERPQAPTGAGDVLRDLIAEAERTGSGPPHVLRLEHVDGRELYLRVQVARVDEVDPSVRYGLTAADATAEYHLHREVAEQREQYRILADHVGDIVLVHGPDRGITWASPSVLPVLGFAPEAIIGLTLKDIAHLDDVGVLPVIGPELPPATHRLRLRTADGDHRWFQATINGGWDDTGALMAVYACLRDIDEQVRVEAAMAASERRMRLALEVSPDGYAIYEAVRDTAGSVTGLTLASMNPAGMAMFPPSRQPAVGQDLRTFLPAAESSGLWAAMLRAIDSGVLGRTRTELDLGTGRLVIDGFQARIDDETLLVSWRDVTEMLEGERLLSRAYDETAAMRVTLQTALDATSDGFAVYGLERDDDDRLKGLRLVHVNAAGAASLGYDPADLIGKELRDFFPGAGDSGLWQEIEIAASSGAPRYHRVHVFGSDRQWESSWDNTVAPVGEERMAITWRDVSSEEAALRQLARTRDEAMYSATHDELTDLPNRALLREHLHDALRGCARGERVGLVFVDLDRFKEINDSHGHAAGDLVLKATAARLNRMVRHGDLAARLSGDEFILVLTRLSTDWAPRQFFARASAQLSEPVWADGVELHPSASLGVVLADPTRDAQDVDALIKAADSEMYRVKAARRRSQPS
ncbi:MAG TPA: diguanylate cyclase, partial [Kineosporiaceae bacterium]|nr:diguanylate cyclase [Kineosporiaceae bacterium]